MRIIITCFIIIFAAACAPQKVSTTRTKSTPVKERKPQNRKKITADFSDVEKLIREKKYEKSLIKLNDYLLDHPFESSAYYLRGFIYYQKKDYKNSLLELNRSLVYNYDSDAVHRLIGDIYRHKQKYKDSIASYTIALDINSHNPETYMNRGICYYRIQDIKSALNDWKKSLKYNPDNPVLRELMETVKEEQIRAKSSTREDEAGRY